MTTNFRRLNFILHIYLSPYYRNIIHRTGNGLTYNNSILSSILFIGKSLYYFVSFGNKLFSRPIKKEKIWLLVSSHNTFGTLEFLFNALPSTIFVTTNTNKYSSVFDDDKVVRITFHRSLLFLYRFPFYFLLILQNFGYYSFSIVDKILESTGVIDASFRILISGKPRALIFANDHNIKNRGLLYAAKKLKIPTIYIQHASISEFFPPLSFDLSLLEGNDSIYKYKSSGPVKGKVELIGMPKYDYFHKYRKSRRVIRKIGVCANLLDSSARIQEIVDFLSIECHNWEISYRAHPRDNRSFRFNKTVAINNAKKENIFNFLLKQDLVICANTSTHLEAILLNIPSILFDMGSEKEMPDYYGYEKNGLIDRANNFEDIIYLIKKYNSSLQDVYPKAAYYNSSIGTKYEGKSQELAIQHILNFLEINQN